jgi:protein-disulfide isomerase
MTSGKQARRQRQEQARPPVRSTEQRRASPRVLLVALLGFAGLAAAIALAFVVSGGGSGSTATTATTLPDADVIAKQFDGIPQQGNVLGKANAPATLVEYIDLQCPICREFEASVMPTIIDRYVRTGKLKVEARPIALIGPDSERGRRAAIAAGLQDKLFNVMQILYFNQGAENGGWLNESMAVSAATSIPGLDVQALRDARNSEAVASETNTFDRQAQADNVIGTPTLLVGKSGATLTSLGAGAPSVAELSAAIDGALG